MRIRWKALIVIVLGTSLLNVALYLVGQRELLPVMAHLEIERVQTQLRLGLSDIYEIVDQLQVIAEDYAAWDDSYAFINSRSADYIKSNLTASTFSNNQSNLLLMVNLQGEVVYGGYYDVNSGSLGRVDNELQQELLREKRLWNFETVESSLGGLYQLGEQIFVLVSEPIVASGGGGPIRGALLMGRVLDQAMLDEFSADWGHEFKLHLLSSAGRAAGTTHVEQSNLFSVEVVSDELLQGQISIMNLFGRPFLKLTAPFSRDFFTHGKIILYTLLRWNLFICMLFAFILYLAVDKALRARELRLEVDAKYQKLSVDFEAILNGIPDPMMHISPDKVVLWANRAGAALLADIAPSKRGRYITQVDYVSGFNGCDNAVERCLVSCKSEEYKAELVDGRIFKEYAYPLLDNQGGLVSVIRLASDITESVFLKREADQHSRLASIGELAAGVAHEINNPIGMLLLNLSLLTDVHADLEPILDEYHEQNNEFELGRVPYPVLRKKIPYLLKEMTEGGLRIKRIVQELKGYARTGAGEEKGNVDVNEIAQAAVRLIEYPIEKATTNFSTNYGKGLPIIKGHFRRLEQVVVNLLINATQAIEAQDQGISLSTCLSNEGTWVIIEVEDQGRGIEPENIDKITDPFFTTRRNEGGTGLGLALSARIAKEHGGTLRISSRVGVGSLVSLKLPYERRSDESEFISGAADSAG